jgi:hypothetical protein
MSARTNPWLEQDERHRGERAGQEVQKDRSWQRMLRELDGTVLTRQVSPLVLV